MTSDTEVKAIFDELDIKVNNITGISTFENFLVKVETDKGNYYLKIFSSMRQGKTGYKLAHLYPLLAEMGVPVPSVLTFDDSLKLIKHPYLIISEIEGEMLCDSINTLNRKELSAFYRELGKTLAMIHSLTFDQFGESFDGKTVTSCAEIGNKGPFKSWKDMHQQIINHRLSHFTGTHFEDLIEPIKLWFKKKEHLIDYDITPRLLHIDLNQKNIFLKNKRISGIIDFDGGFVGHNEEELMRTEGAHFSTDTDLRESFFNGYTELIPLDDNYETRRTFYYLSRLLVHVDCVILYGNNYVKNVEKEQERIRSEITKILEEKPVHFDKNKQNT